MPRSRFDAVLFDLDGVLVDTEPWWDEVRESFAAAHGRRWGPEDQAAVMGANSRGWAAIMRRRLGLRAMTEHAILDAIVGGVLACYRDREPPQVPGALEALRRIASARPVAIASSSHPAILAAAVDALGLRDVLGAVVSSDEVAHGKPAPDVYLRAAGLLAVASDRCLVVEDSVNGVRAGHAAGMTVVLVPSHSVPPSPEARALAHVVLDRLADLDPDALPA